MKLVILALIAHSPIEVTELGIEMLVNPVQQNARSPMEVTELGIETLVRLVHPSNVDFSMKVTELGISILVVRLRQT